MKSKKNNILIGLFIVVVLSSLYFMRKISEPLRDVKSAQIDFELDATQLINSFVENEENATKSYVDKIINVKGKVKDISVNDDKLVITLANQDNTANILCHLNQEEKMKALNLEKNSFVMIKGVCTGFLMDVIMVRCVLIEK